MRHRGRIRSLIRKDHDVKLNITPMMDIFIIILVFLLKTFSAQGQLVTPAAGLTLPTSSVDSRAAEALSVKIMEESILLENIKVVEASDFKAEMNASSETLIKPLFDALTVHAREARKGVALFGGDFSGEITIQGDKNVSYKMLTRVMHTCSKAGYPVMNLLVYRED